MTKKSRSPHRFLLALSSALVAIGLLALLMKIGHIDLKLTTEQVRNTSPFAFAKLVLLNVVVVYLSTTKWRSVDKALRTKTDSVPSRVESFATTSFGMALGLVLPVQLGMATARTVGTYIHGQPLKRGGAGTLIEQLFDFVTVAFLAVASGLTWYFHGRGQMWSIFAISLSGCAALGVGTVVEILRRKASRISVLPMLSRWKESFETLGSSYLLDQSLARRLLLLSTARFCAVVLMTAQTARAVSAPIPLWQLAASTPFVVVTTAFGITPGGIGVNELTVVSALTVLGTPLTVAARWSIANRLLATASCFVVALGAGIIRSATRHLLIATQKVRGEG